MSHLSGLVNKWSHILRPRMEEMCPQQWKCYLLFPAHVNFTTVAAEILIDFSSPNLIILLSSISDCFLCWARWSVCMCWLHGLERLCLCEPKY